MTPEEKRELKRQYQRERYLKIKADPKAYRLRLFEERVYKRMRYRNDKEYRERENERCRIYKLKRKQNENAALHTS